MATRTLTTLPTEILASVFEYFVDDHETLENLSITHPKLAPTANVVRDCVRRVLVRGNGAQEACRELVETLHGCQNDARSSNIVGPIRYLELMFDSRAEFQLADATQEVLDALPAVQHVTLKINARPFPDSAYKHDIENLKEKTHRAVQDYAKLMDMLNTLKPQRRIGLSLILNDCMLRSSPLIAQQYPNITLREFDVKVYLCRANTIVSLAERLVYATKTLTDFTILEDQANGWYRESAHHSRIPFSGLTSLKGLHIPASLWFEESAYGGNGGEGPQGFLWKRENVRPSILHLLPPSLSSLRVDFTGCAAIFAVGMGYRAVVPRMTSDEAKMKMKPCWDWIYEIAAAGPSRFPYLNRVEVLELEDRIGQRCQRPGRCRGHCQEEEPVVWDPPLELKKAFEDRGIGLRIQIRGRKVRMPMRRQPDVMAT
jgi:hypothetical protein